MHGEWTLYCLKQPFVPHVLKATIGLPVGQSPQMSRVGILAKLRPTVPQSGSISSGMLYLTFCAVPYGTYRTGKADLGRCD
jgi:hypothetical protein